MVLQSSGIRTNAGFVYRTKIDQKATARCRRKNAFSRKRRGLRTIRTCACRAVRTQQQTSLIEPPPYSPNRSSLISLAAWMPSSFRFFSICLLRAKAALSSAEEVQPILQVPSVQNVAPVLSYTAVETKQARPHTSCHYTHTSEH